MSDMVDRLGEVAAEAGLDAGDRLAAEAVTVQLSSRVRRGARRRRLAAASLAFAVVLSGAAAVIVPQLLAPVAVDPAATGRAPVQTKDGLVTYDDGSMQVLTHGGNLVNVPAAAVASPVFAPETADAACATDVTALIPGWKPQFADAFQLVTFARPLLLDDAGYHVLAQGQRVGYHANSAAPQIAFSVDVDPAIAPYVVMTMTTYAVAPGGKVAYFASQLESRPAVEYSGDKTAGTYTTTLTTRALQGGGECKGVAPGADWTSTSSVARYLVVTAFLNDGHGHVNPIATHTSWLTFTKEGA